MSSQPANHAEPSPELLQHQAAQDAQYYRRVLHRLIEIGAEMAEDILQQATAPVEPGAAKPDLTLRLERITRAVRRSILLARKVAEPLPTRTHPLRAPEPVRAAARKRIIREVEDAIQRKAWHEQIDNPDVLTAELLERLDSVDLDQEIMVRATPDIIKDIIRDFGLAHLPGTHPWKRRTPRDIDQLQTRAAAPPEPKLPKSEDPEKATAPP